MIDPTRELADRTLAMSSVTRIWDPKERLDIARVPRGEWALGDYVVVEVLEHASGRGFELRNGRFIEPSGGDLFVGALGSRFATLEATGSWEDVGEDGQMHVLTGGGVVGKCRTRSTLVGPLLPVRYKGHPLEAGERRDMWGCVHRSEARGPRARSGAPVVLLTGTSMSAGKTTAASVLIRSLKSRGFSVLGAKLAGAGRYRDILSMHDAGADRILDFVDAGLPSTCCPRDRYEEALDVMLDQMSAGDEDVAVVEIGASPLEPYNGDMAIEAIRDWIAVHVLCASDPYAVVGALHAYGLETDLVTGTTSNTEAGVQLVERLSGLSAVDLRRYPNAPELAELLDRRLGAAR